MHLWEAILLGAIEGLTEFLPVSSTGHLTITEKLLGYSIDDPDVTAFTAIIQIGAVLATVLYLRKDIARLVGAFLRGLRSPGERRTADFRFALAILAGSIPIGIIGLAFKDQIETTLRSLWFVGCALILWSGVMWFADRVGTQRRPEGDVRLRDTLTIGLAQCLALIPGISRSGATISAGLLLGIDRVAATRLSFFLAIPALAGATLLQAVSEFDNIANGVGWGPTLVATFVSFVVGYVAVAWLLKFVARHGLGVFIGYRLALGTAVLVLVGTGAISAT
ncbi:undecaprenyl-diphosphate phosphatase [Patulibacter sp. SYSU D01012]|uniref:undecaprenyl-diphosphate phosphatase n=1 Tax=Patulibacter sp. SYSU D01012 TaxID=2817381 RepID=UPI001B305546|nr:undecaprenyl-diphosphate phosphatase [Patulibacter sp. SYSU D01012]